MTYTLTIANAGPSVARDVVLSDALPGEWTEAEYSLDNGVTFQPWPGNYVMGDLAPGAAPAGAGSRPDRYFGCGYGEKHGDGG